MAHLINKQQCMVAFIIFLAVYMLIATLDTSEYKWKDETY